MINKPRISSDWPFEESMYRFPRVYNFPLFTEKRRRFNWNRATYIATALIALFILGFWMAT